MTTRLERVSEKLTCTVALQSAKCTGNHDLFLLSGKFLDMGLFRPLVVMIMIIMMMLNLMTMTMMTMLDLPSLSKDSIME